MITLWISVSLLALTGWQGYRLGKEYGWWSKSSPPNSRKKKGAPAHDTTEGQENGLGRSKTDFGRLLDGYTPLSPQGIQSQNDESGEGEHDQEPTIIEPSTTLMVGEELNVDTQYPDETDLVPETCSWMDEEEIALVDAETDEMHSGGQPIVALSDYVKRVRTVQRKINQITKRRNADSTFVKQELGMLIETYQLENDQSLDWLFQQHGAVSQPDYGSLFDRIESLAT